MAKTKGQKAYEGYCNFSGGKSLISGASLPEWDEQAEDVRGAWEAAAIAAGQPDDVAGGSVAGESAADDSDDPPAQGPGQGPIPPGSE